MKKVPGGISSPRTQGRLLCTGLQKKTPKRKKWDPAAVEMSEYPKSITHFCLSHPLNLARKVSRERGGLQRRKKENSDHRRKLLSTEKSHHREYI